MGERASQTAAERVSRKIGFGTNAAAARTRSREKGFTTRAQSVAHCRELADHRRAQRRVGLASLRVVLRHRPTYCPPPWTTSLQPHRPRTLAVPLRDQNALRRPPLPSPPLTTHSPASTASTLFGSSDGRLRAFSPPNRGTRTSLQQSCDDTSTLRITNINR